MRNLVKSADKKMSSLGLCFSSEDADTENSSGSSSEESSFEMSSKKTKQRKKKHSKSKRSGMVKKMSDRVLYLQTWPQSVLQYEFVSDKVAFEKLDLKLFAAGEVEMSPVKRICVFEHSVMTNFNCACPAIQRGQGSGFLSEGSH